ncbi:C25 family cysteine peptidase [Maridesulfovibrio hydrothermalis]|uniref:Sporulation domain protein n=1 Tax=Maridesulfovibrio hydrothermalis AM13 = DSM 14728 TaxID=1121451 RepID=L0R8X7_9BACT|nr:C25 family cysteine peptidase [Maridesulfovibrio hydrothermalis]CCO22635.1 Sporulation domain protein [Maridesulfovibrio hydrothermalis AM13 = DSM 14728]
MIVFRKIILSLCLFFLILPLGGCKLKGFAPVQEPVAVLPVPVKVSSAPFTEKKKAVIVCSAEFMRAARYFSYLHREFEGVKSVIVKIPATNGTAEFRAKIMSGIKAQVSELNSSGQVLSVLILGNKDVVPVAEFRSQNGTVIHFSDYGYGGAVAGSEKMVPVGRIPARSGEEAELVAAKYERWYEDRAFRPAWPVSFIGGEGFSGDYLSDPELLFFSLQQEGIAGPEAIRYLGAAGGCEPKRLRQSFAEDDVSVQWLALEAGPAGFKVGNGTLTVTEIMDLDYKPGLPVVLNPSCEAALLNSSMPTPAEAIVLSQGAGLAVMTGCSSSGRIRAELDGGRVYRVDSSGTHRLLLEFHKAYFGGKHRIAEALTEARAQFAQNRREGEDLTPLYDLIFYGDPVMSLPLPVRTESPAYLGLVTVGKSEKSSGIAVFPVNSTISFAMEEGGIYPAVRLQVIDRLNGKIVSSMKVQEDDVFNFSADGEGRYLIYSRPLDGPLAWQFFDVRKGGAAETAAAGTDSIKLKKASPRITAGLKPVRYAIQVSSNRKEDSAIKVRRKLSVQGYEAYVVKVASANNRKWYCVRFGEFDSWADAVEASAEYERKEQADVKIVRCNRGS